MAKGAEPAPERSFVWLGTPGGSSCCAGISQRSFALLALPRVAQERCESPTSPSLPPLPASKGHFAGPQQRRFERAHKVLFTSILSTPLGFLHGSDHVEAASCFCPACSSWSPKHHKCAPEPRARLQQICSHHPQREHSIALPMPMGGGIPLLWCSWHLSEQQEWHSAPPAFLWLYSMTLGEGHFIQNLKFSDPGHQGNASNRRSWQHSLSLWALPCAHGGTCMTLCKVWGWGLLGRTAKTESSSILAWSLLASPLGMGYLHRVSSCFCPAKQLQ